MQATTPTAHGELHMYGIGGVILAILLILLVLWLLGVIRF